MSHGSRAIVNVDYLLLAGITAWWRVRGARLSVAFTALFLLDLLFSAAPSFNFNGDDALFALGELSHGDWRLIAVAVAGFGTLTVAGVAFDRLTNPWPKDRLSGVILVATLGLAAVGADVINGSNSGLRRNEQAMPVNLAGSGLVHFAKSVYAFGLIRINPAPISLVPAATDSLRAALRAAPTVDALGAHKLVIAVIESLGELQSSSTEAALRQRFSSPAITSRFEIRTGTVPSEGATTDAEFRELCGDNNNYRGASRESREHCLLAEAHRLGLSSVAFHGYRRWMFNRVSWYPRLGFDELRFRSNLVRGDGTDECGTMFRGACDSVVTRAIRDRLTRAPERPELLYWVSLSSHFPLSSNAASGKSCAWAVTPTAPPEVCTLFGAMWPAIDGLARMAEDPSLPPAWYVIVGDHPPPFVSGARDLFRPHRVPFVELRPRRTIRQTDSAPER